MKKALTILFLTLSIVIILDSLHASEAIMMFLLAGVIPGTHTALSGAQMLEFFTFLIGFTLSRVTMSLVRMYTNAIAEHRITDARAS
jgi:hypothetical protein